MTIAPMPRVVAGWMLALAAPGLLALAALTNAAAAPPIDGPVACVFAAITGVSCPFCGMTRAIVALGRGDVSGALHHHPLVFVVFALSMFAGVCVARDRVPRALRSLRAKHALACVLAIWVVKLL